MQGGEGERREAITTELHTYKLITRIVRSVELDCFGELSRPTADPKTIPKDGPTGLLESMRSVTNASEVSVASLNTQRKLTKYVPRPRRRCGMQAKRKKAQIRRYRYRYAMTGHVLPKANVTKDNGAGNQKPRGTIALAT